MAGQGFDPVYSEHQSGMNFETEGEGVIFPPSHKLAFVPVESNHSLHILNTFERYFFFSKANDRISRVRAMNLEVFFYLEA